MTDFTCKGKGKSSLKYKSLNIMYTEQAIKIDTKLKLIFFWIILSLRFIIFEIKKNEKINVMPSGLVRQKIIENKLKNKKLKFIK